MATDLTADRTCNGAVNCRAERHIHGCFADYGNCDNPTEHERGATVATDHAQIIRDALLPRHKLRFSHACKSCFAHAALDVLVAESDRLDAAFKLEVRMCDQRANALVAAEAALVEARQDSERDQEIKTDLASRLMDVRAERDALAAALEWKNVDQMRELAQAMMEREALAAALREILTMTGALLDTSERLVNIANIARRAVSPSTQGNPDA